MNLYCCGANEYGQLGLGDKDYRSELTLVPLSNIGTLAVSDTLLVSSSKCWFFPDEKN